MEETRSEEINRMQLNVFMISHSSMLIICYSYSCCFVNKTLRPFLSFLLSPASVPILQKRFNNAIYEDAIVFTC